MTKKAIKSLRHGLLLCVALFSANAQAQVTDLFKPYKSTDLRLPAVPIIVNDPYFSIWQSHDALNGGSTMHWTEVDKPVEAYLRVDGVTYRVMGAEERPVLKSIVPMASEEHWEGSYTKQTPAKGWEKPGFNDSSWKRGKAAFGSDNIKSVRTNWTKEHSDIYVRRTVNLTAEDLASDLYFVFSHDDAAECYINGVEVARGRMDLVEDERVRLDGDLKKALRKGENVIAMHCYNNTGFALVDFGIYKDVTVRDYEIKAAKQLSVDVMPTSSYYTFQCGKVQLSMVFTAPMIIDDYDLLSCPINYISYQVKSLDRKQHDVQFMLLTTPLLAVNKDTQPTMTERVNIGGRNYLRTGTINQPILATKGDGVCIDWGYLYMPEFGGTLSIARDADAKRSFADKGVLPASLDKVRSNNEAEMPVMCYERNLGSTKETSGFTMLGYDEVEDIEYMYNRYKAYWAHEGKVTLDDMFVRLQNEYSSIMNKCREWDKRIYDDGMAAGGKQYAEILSGSYRHVLAAHKLFRDNEGHLLYFSKENNSNGCVNTVDLTYPSAPLYLVYQPELLKGMMTSILEYSRTGRWTKPFAAHDLGTYPIADGQVYGGDMPLEEAGNIIILCAQLAKMEGNTNYVNPYWDILKTWTDYLVENGQDPANQLCTDDFAGHWAHNCNLSVKAIMGVAGFAELARLRGDNALAEKYMNKAKEMGAKWEADAREGDHYRLAFDRNNTWSQKYNMVWDKVWNTNIFPNGAMQREVKYYLTKQNKYGLPLDIRKDYTKSDWVMWTAAMADDTPTFLKFVEPIYNYINETDSRVPISDWHDTKTGLKIGFKARSVIGGYWMRVLLNKQ